MAENEIDIWINDAWYRFEKREIEVEKMKKEILKPIIGGVLLLTILGMSCFLQRKKNKKQEYQTRM